jgi:hypothetical protein
MSTRQIPPEEWRVFLDEFSKRHAGKSAHAELHGRGVIQHEEVKRLPFVGASLETKGSDAGAVRVQLGEAATDHLTHEVPDARAVWVRPDGDEGGEMLEIQGEDHTLILKFR